MTYAADIVRALGKLIPDCDPDLLRLYALLVLTTGEDTTLENVHDAWALARLATRPDHPDLVPFADLAPAIQAYDKPYQDAIRETARGRRRDLSALLTEADEAIARIKERARQREARS